MIFFFFFWLPKQACSFKLAVCLGAGSDLKGARKERGESEAALKVICVLSFSDKG